MKSKMTPAMKKRIAEREAKFKRMSSAEKRVAIAQDVLEALGADKIKPKTGAWVRVGMTDSEAAKQPRNKQVRDVLVDAGPCMACAMGAMFMCAVIRADVIEVSDCTPGWRTFGVYDLDYNVVDDYLRDYFEQEQLRMIEIAFERGTGMFMEDGDDESRACRFGDKKKSARERMTAIMKNIIENKGKFVP